MDMKIEIFYQKQFIIKKIDNLIILELDCYKPIYVYIVVSAEKCLRERKMLQKLTAKY